MRNDIFSGLMFVAIGAVGFGGLGLLFQPRSVVVCAAIGAAAGLAMALYARGIQKRINAGRRPPPHQQ